MEVTLALGIAPITLGSEQHAGGVSLWGPARTQFAQPAQMTLPFRMQAGQLFVRAHREDGTGFTIEPSRLAIDAASQLLRFEVEQLAAFQPATRQVCNANATCPTPYECREGYCR